MRIRIVHKPLQASIDGVRLDFFEVGHVYDLGNTIASYLLAEGWAEPAAEGATIKERSFLSSSTPNLIRGKYPPYLDDLDFAADFERRRRRRE